MTNFEHELWLVRIPWVSSERCWIAELDPILGKALGRLGIATRLVLAKANQVDHVAADEDPASRDTSLQNSALL